MLILPLEDTQIRYLVIDADNRAYRYYLSEIVENYDFIYIRLSGENLDIDQAQSQIFAQDLIENDSTQSHILILDECDRLAPDAYDYLLDVLNQLSFPKVVLFTREPISIPQNSPNSSTITYITSNGIRSALSVDEQKPLLQVKAFGVGQTWINGREIDFSQYSLLHEFFFYTLAQGAVLRTDAIDEFWSAFNHKSAVSNFHVTRKNLDYLLGIEFLVFLGTHYELNPIIQVQYDVADYRQLFDDISFDDSNLSIPIYREVYNLYQGDFLMSFDSHWVISLRDKLRKQHSDVCFVLGKSEQTSEQALGYYAQAFRLNPYREDVAEAMMLFYLEQGLACDALNVYNTLRDNLHHCYDIEPQATIIELGKQARMKC